MPEKPYNIVVGITGASGSVYAKSLIEYLCILQQNHKLKIDIIYSETGKEVALHETGKDFTADYQVNIYENYNFHAPFASGSSVADALVVVPCSMGTLGRIAHGSSDNLICRTADVILKEKKKLILVTRESPLNLIHIKNMELITLAGGIVLPASPSFYLKPQTIDELVNTITYRIVDLLCIPHEIPRWGQ